MLSLLILEILIKAILISFTSKKSQIDLNKNRGNLGFMEREIDNKIKNIIGGRIRKGPYVRK